MVRKSTLASILAVQLAMVVTPMNPNFWSVCRDYLGLHWHSNCDGLQWTHSWTSKLVLVIDLLVLACVCLHLATRRLGQGSSAPAWIVEKLFMPAGPNVQCVSEDAPKPPVVTRKDDGTGEEDVADRQERELIEILAKQRAKEGGETKQIDIGVCAGAPAQASTDGSDKPTAENEEVAAVRRRSCEVIVNAAFSSAFDALLGDNEDALPATLASKERELIEILAKQREVAAVRRRSSAVIVNAAFSSAFDALLGDNEDALPATLASKERELIEILAKQRAKEGGETKRAGCDVLPKKESIKCVDAVDDYNVCEEFDCMRRIRL